MSKVESVPSGITEQLRHILERYSNVFSKDEWDLGWTDMVTHKIDVGNRNPIRRCDVILHRIYRLLISIFQTCYGKESSSPQVALGHRTWYLLRRKMAR